MKYRAYYAVGGVLAAVSGVILFLHFGGRIDGAQIIWPPAYYILRDRVPFLLTIVYTYRHKVPARDLHLFGWGLTGITAVGGFAALILRVFVGRDMTAISTIHWSAPSPITWGPLSWPRFCC